MHIDRLYTRQGHDVYAATAFVTHTADDGEAYIVPRHWSASAVEILVDRVFCRHPLPAATRARPEDGVPAFLWPRAAEPETAPAQPPRFERDIRDVLHRVAGSLACSAARAGLFDGEDDAAAFYDELRHMLLYQIAAPELSLWRGAGLDWAYGQGFPSEKIVFAERVAGLSDSFSLPSESLAGLVISPQQPQTDVLKRIRILSGIAQLSAPHAPITVTMPVENIDAADFISGLRQADIDVLARDLGRKMLRRAVHLVIDNCNRASLSGFDPAFNAALALALRDARAAGVPDTVLHLAVTYARQGYEDIDLGGNAEEDSAAPFKAVLSLPDTFIETALTGHGFAQVRGGQAAGHADAAKLWDKLAENIWASGAPALLFRDSAAETLNVTALSGIAGGEGDAPASADAAGAGLGGGGFYFLPETEAPGAVINLLALQGDGDAVVQPAAVLHAARIMMITLDAALDMASVSPRTQALRPVVLGAVNMPSLLMARGIAYDSDAGRAVAGLLTALLSGAAHLASAEMADSAGAFDGYAAISRGFLQGVKDRRAALAGASRAAKGVTRRPGPVRPSLSPDPHLADAARTIWDRAYALGREQGFRHAHLTGFATDVSLQGLLSAQTRDIMPEPAPARFESYFADQGDAGVVYGRKLNPVVVQGLKRLGYSPQQVDDIYAYVVGHGSLLDAPAVNHAALRACGFDDAMIQAVEKALRPAQHLRHAFNVWVLGADIADRLPQLAGGGEDDLLAALGFSEDDIESASLHACGAMTLEGAPHLLPQHLAAFDCVAPAGAGVRRVSAAAQIAMQAAVEPFLSGTVLHTVALGHYTPIEDVQKLVLSAWEQGLKTLRLYRDGASLLYPVAETAATLRHAASGDISACDTVSPRLPARVATE